MLNCKRSSRMFLWIHLSFVSQGFDSLFMEEYMVDAIEIHVPEFLFLGILYLLLISALLIPWEAETYVKYFLEVFLENMSTRYNKIGCFNFLRYHEKQNVMFLEPLTKWYR